jgi:hypothetical protein
MAFAKRARAQLACGDLDLDEERATPALTVDTYADAWLVTAGAMLKASSLRFYTANLARHVGPLLGSRPITSAPTAGS